MKNKEKDPKKKKTIKTETPVKIQQAVPRPSVSKKVEEEETQKYIDQSRRIMDQTECFCVLFEGSPERRYILRSASFIKIFSEFMNIKLREKQIDYVAVSTIEEKYYQKVEKLRQIRVSTKLISKVKYFGLKFADKTDTQHAILKKSSMMKISSMAYQQSSDQLLTLKSLIKIKFKTRTFQEAVLEYMLKSGGMITFTEGICAKKPQSVKSNLLLLNELYKKTEDWFIKDAHAYRLNFMNVQGDVYKVKLISKAQYENSEDEYQASEATQALTAKSIRDEDEIASEDMQAPGSPLKYEEAKLSGNLKVNKATSTLLKTEELQSKPKMRKQKPKLLKFVLKPSEEVNDYVIPKKVDLKKLNATLGEISGLLQTKNSPVRFKQSDLISLLRHFMYNDSITNQSFENSHVYNPKFLDTYFVKLNFFKKQVCLMKSSTSTIVEASNFSEERLTLTGSLSKYTHNVDKSSSLINRSALSYYPNSKSNESKIGISHLFRQVNKKTSNAMLGEVNDIYEVYEYFESFNENSKEFCKDLVQKLMYYPGRYGLRKVVYSPIDSNQTIQGSFGLCKENVEEFEEIKEYESTSLINERDISFSDVSNTNRLLNSKMNRELLKVVKISNSGNMEILDIPRHKKSYFHNYREWVWVPEIKLKLSEIKDDNASASSFEEHFEVERIAFNLVRKLEVKPYNSKSVSVSRKSSACLSKLNHNSYSLQNIHQYKQTQEKERVDLEFNKLSFTYETREVDSNLNSNKYVIVVEVIRFNTKFNVMSETFNFDETTKNLLGKFLKIGTSNPKGFVYFDKTLSISDSNAFGMFDFKDDSQFSERENSIDELQNDNVNVSKRIQRLVICSLSPNYKTIEDKYGEVDEDFFESYFNNSIIVANVEDEDDAFKLSRVYLIFTLYDIKEENDDRTSSILVYEIIEERDVKVTDIANFEILKKVPSRFYRAPPINREVTVIAQEKKEDSSLMSDETRKKRMAELRKLKSEQISSIPSEENRSFKAQDQYEPTTKIINLSGHDYFPTRALNHNTDDISCTKDQSESNIVIQMTEPLVRLEIKDIKLIQEEIKEISHPAIAEKAVIRQDSGLVLKNRNYVKNENTEVNDQIEDKDPEDPNNGSFFNTTENLCAYLKDQYQENNNEEPSLCRAAEAEFEKKIEEMFEARDCKKKVSFLNCNKLLTYKHSLNKLMEIKAGECILETESNEAQELKASFFNIKKSSNESAEKESVKNSTITITSIKHQKTESKSYVKQLKEDLIIMKEKEKVTPLKRLLLSKFESSSEQMPFIPNSLKKGLTVRPHPGTTRSGQETKKFNFDLKPLDQKILHLSDFRAESSFKSKIELMKMKLNFK